MGKKIIIIFINLTGQNRGLSGLKSIWPVIMTGDLLSVILSLGTENRRALSANCRMNKIRLNHHVARKGASTPIKFVVKANVTCRLRGTLSPWCAWVVWHSPERPSSVYAEFKEQLMRDKESWYETGQPWRGDHPLQCYQTIKREVCVVSIV